MPDTIKISELDEALAIADAAEFPYTQENGGELTTFKAPLTQIAAKVVEDMSYAGINLPVGAGVKSVENTLNYLLGAVGGDPNGNISDSYDPTAAYVKGDLCIYENVLYICTAPTTGTFDPSSWTATTIDNIIGSLSTLTTTDKSSLVGAVNSLIPTAYTQATRSSALSSGALGFVKIGKVVIANLNYTTNTSNVSTHDTVLYSDLPPAISNIYLNFVDEAGNVTRTRMGTDGKLHLHYSTITANKEINGSFVYLST